MFGEAYPCRRKFHTEPLPFDETVDPLCFLPDGLIYRRGLPASADRPRNSSSSKIGDLYRNGQYRADFSPTSPAEPR